MSQFDAYTTPEYVEKLRGFLRLKKKHFLRSAGLVRKPDEKRKGRLPSYPGEAVKALAQLVNDKAARAEAADSTLGERFRIARDYLSLSDNQVAIAVGVSRELVRRWGENIHAPSGMKKLAEFLGVPEVWLAQGSEDSLPANSHIGVRVEDEAFFWREQLYSLELQVIADLPDDADVTYAQAFIENAVMTQPALAQAARRAGGRWQSVSGMLLFAPWVPIEEHGLARRYWSDAVEAIIQEELATRPTVYSAWAAVRQRCEAMGLDETQYPRRISLHKRIETERERIQRYGVDLNAMIRKSSMQHDWAIVR